MDESEYLQPDFDPKTLKVAQLRNILLQNDVDYVSSAKKADLIALFNANIKPTAARRLKMIEKVEPNDDSIEVVDVKPKKQSKRAVPVEPEIISISDDDDAEEVQVVETKKSVKKLGKIKSPTPEPVSKPRKVSASSKKKTKKESLNSDLESAASEAEEEHESNDEDQKPRSRKTRKTSGKTKSIEFERQRSLSPKKRSASKKSDLSPSRVTRSISGTFPAADGTESDTKRERSPIRKTSRRAKSEEPKPELTVDSQKGKSAKHDTSIIESEVQHFTKSGADENIFQSSPSIASSNSKNPKKRSAAAEEDDDHKPAKNKKSKSVKQATLFSDTAKTPTKPSSESSSLKMDKFEKSIPSSNGFNQQKGNLFEFDDESLEKALERSPARKSPKKDTEVKKTEESKDSLAKVEESEPVEPKKEPMEQQDIVGKENETPVIDSSSNSYDITEETPTLRNKLTSFIPSVSAIIKNVISPKTTPKANKVLQFTKFSDSDTTEPLGMTTTGDVTITEETHELLRDDADKSGFIEIEKEFAEEPEQEDSIFKNDVEEELSAHPNDEDIAKLQLEIQSTEHQMLEEAEEAARIINQVLESEEETKLAAIAAEQSEDVEDGEMSAAVLRKPFVDLNAVVDFFNSVVFFGVLISIAIGSLWYREQRILVGYCGSEIYQPAIPNASNDFSIKINDFLEDYKPSCLPCPENAICLPSMQIRCKADYVVEEPWYKVYGLLPFRDSCVKDTKKEQIIKEVVAKSLELLRLRNANFKCGDGNNEEDLERIGISDEELYEFFFRTKKSALTDGDFDELWDSVLTDLSKEPEITVRQVISNSLSTRDRILTLSEQLQHRGSVDPSNTDDDFSSDEAASEGSVHQKIVFRSTSTAKLSVHCKFQKDVKERFEKYKVYIVSGIAFIVSSMLLYVQITSYLNQKRRIHEISEVILGKLMKQQKCATNDSTGTTHRYISTLTLRDELLANLSTSKRVQMWGSILKSLESNVNVRSTTKEIHGEIVRVLEWIGE
ncbi:hypothetical protein WICPIJ_008569 [Wickerhamomyces pijperi]|uniref:Inner nuclear membrane protein SRC1 n=1 Tax=Wickerhamomyces pijperi TaxID=599730 RepID=A0A9P8PWG2_WICPI|nr:hypothetical protein WICPIJ_008569 [Wickerhamomyces pijperi]